MGQAPGLDRTPPPPRTWEAWPPLLLMSDPTASRHPPPTPLRGLFSVRTVAALSLCSCLCGETQNAASTYELTRTCQCHTLTSTLRPFPSRCSRIASAAYSGEHRYSSVLPKSSSMRSRLKKETILSSALSPDKTCVIAVTLTSSPRAKTLGRPDVASGPGAVTVEIGAPQSLCSHRRSTRCSLSQHR